jgi:hypothetical protein
LSTQTSNYKFVKPELTDVADITAINANWDKIDTELKSHDDSQVSKVALGNPIRVDNSANLPLVDMHIYGKSTQDGTPTHNAPVSIVSVTEGGNVKVGVYGKNLFNLNAYKNITNSTASYGLEWDGDILAITSKTDDAYTVFTPTALPDGATIPVVSGKKVTMSWETDATANVSGLVYIFGNGITGKNSFINATAKKLTYVVPDDVTFLTFRLGVEKSGNTIKYWNIQFEISDVATEYEEYKGQTLTLSTLDGLKGIPVSSGGNYTDENGQQWICDEIDLARGVYVQRVKEYTFDGSEDEAWNKDSTSDENKKRMVTSIFKSEIKITPNNQIANVLCDKFVKANANDTYSMAERISVDDLGRVHIYCSLYNSEVKNWTSFLTSNPMTVIYELATPIETPLSADEISTYAQLVTNKPNTTVLNDSGADMSVEYYTARNENCAKQMLNAHAVEDISSDFMTHNVNDSFVRVENISVFKQGNVVVGSCSVVGDFEEASGADLLWTINDKYKPLQSVFVCQGIMVNSEGAYCEINQPVVVINNGVLYVSDTGLGAPCIKIEVSFSYICQ